MSTNTTTYAGQEAFAAERIRFIGGSDVANLFDLEPYYCNLRLFNQKTGKQASMPFHGNKATDRGTKLERLAANEYAEQTGRQIRKATPRVDPVVPCLRPQPDFEILNDARGKELGTGTLSIKVPGREAFSRLKAAITALRELRNPRAEWERKIMEEGKKKLLPYELQLNAELGAANRDWGSYGFFWADGMDIASADAERDDSVVASIRERAADFWKRKEAGVAPPKLDPTSAQCGNCEFRVTCQSDHLLSLLKKEGKSELVQLLPILDTLRDEYRERQELQKEAESLVDETKEKTRRVLEEAGCDVGEGETSRVYNRLQSGRESLQKAPLLKFITEKSKIAAMVLKNEEKGTIPPLLPDLKELIVVLAKMPDTISTKFINVGDPFRVLKFYDKAAQ